FAADPDADHPAPLLAYPHRVAGLQRQPDGHLRAEPVAELRRSRRAEPAILEHHPDHFAQYAATDLQQRLEPLRRVAHELAELCGSECRGPRTRVLPRHESNHVQWWQRVLAAGELVLGRLSDATRRHSL